MEGSAYWFVLMAALSLAGLWLGAFIARHTKHRGRASLVAAMLLLLSWAWLLHHPSVAVQIVPLEVLSVIEGAASVPVFLFIIGVAWARVSCARQRRLVAWAVVLGCVYFVNGNFWLLQATPQVGFAQTMQGSPYVKQSQEYSCVPAACATALRVLGVRASEAEMAQLTQTRPGTGSTLLRAMEGLKRKLAGRGYSVTVLEPRLEDLQWLPTPMLTPLKFERTRLHMVTVTSVSSHGAWISDPMGGSLFYTWRDLAAIYTGRALIIERQ